jgi:hypothetical protein
MKQRCGSGPIQSFGKGSTDCGRAESKLKRSCTIEGTKKLFAWFALLAAVAMAQDLSGVIDLHAHCAPDTSARSIDAIDLAKLARERGMRGIVLKNHQDPTASLAYVRVR